MVARVEEGLRDWVRKVKGLRSTGWHLQSSHGDVKYSIGNIINNIVITMYGARWLLEISRGPLYKLYDCVTTLLTPETNTK